MRASVSPGATLAGLVVGLLSAYGCSSDDTTGTNNPFVTPTGGSASTGASGSTATNTAGVSPGTSGSNTNASGASQGGGSGAAGSSAGEIAGSGGQSIAGAASGGTAAGGGGAVMGDITKVVPSAGCGKPFAGQSGAKVTIPTKGTKDANCADKLNGAAKCGLWGQAGSTWQPTPLMRDYYVNLPANYDMNKAYPLVLQGPGCGSDGSPKNVYPLTAIAGQVIRVGLTPPPSSIGHGTNENQGCFDDKEGDDSVDWVFYENMYDKLNQEVCFDRNRVFTSGNSSGSWFSNELGCKYAGDAVRPVRGVLPNTGGLPNEAIWAPTCSTKPMAGMWIHEVMDPTNPITGNKFAIARAMKVNGCTGATGYDDAMLADFPIGGGYPDATCKLIKNCPALYPLVLCALPGNMHGSHDQEVAAGFPTFIKQFSAGAFLTQ